MTMMSPAISMMGKMKYPVKFITISILFLFPLLWFFFNSLSALNEDLSFTDRELSGSHYLKLIRPLPEKIAERRGMMNAIIQGNSSLESRLTEINSDINRSLEVLTADADGLSGLLDVESQVRELHGLWRVLESSSDINAKQSFNQHTAIIDKLKKLIVLVADNSNLILDPVLDSFYLMDSVVLRLPEITENLGKIRGMAMGMSVSGRADREQIFIMKNLIAEVRGDSESLEHGLRQAGSVNRDILKELLVPVKESNQATENYLVYIEENTATSFDLEELRADDVFNRGSSVIGATFEVYDRNLAKLQGLLSSRLAAYKKQRNIELLTIVISLSVIVYLYVAFYLSVQSSIKAIVETSRELMMGNLTARIDIDTNDETAEIHRSFNSMANNFNDIVKDVNQVSGVLNNSVENVAVVAEQTSKNVRSQRDQTQQVAAAITEMSASANEIASNTSRASAASDSAFEKTTGANDIVRSSQVSVHSLVEEIDQAVIAMNAMAAESKSIGQVLDVIKSVAEQTNLLALNAAIEAARAGEQGRGFAVVADEVRTLAQKTHNSTSEIESMIEKLQQRSGEAVAVIESGQKRARATETQSLQAAEGLKEVEAAISELNQMITGIACAAEQQTATCEEISRNIINIEDSTRDTSEGADQTATAGTAMASEAERLTSMVGRFTTA